MMIYQATQTHYDPEPFNLGQDTPPVIFRPTLPYTQ